jgi:hypothetical protein
MMGGDGSVKAWFLLLNRLGVNICSQVGIYIYILGGLLQNCGSIKIYSQLSEQSRIHP